MAYALSSNVEATALRCSPSSVKQLLVCNPNFSCVNLSSRHRTFRSSVALARRGNHGSAAVTSSSKRKKKKGFGGDSRKGQDEDLEDDPFEALFSQLEEDLKNGNSELDDDDGEINEEDIEALARELEEALAGDGDMGLFDPVVKSDHGDGGDVEGDYDDDDDDDDVEEDERPAKLKNWQLRRLAYALKTGRRKTSIKNLAAELCLDRAYVLELLRDPPPNLVMLSASLPDEPAPAVPIPENESPKPVTVESTSDVMETETKVKEPIHVMQHRWSAQKRLKKVQVETLERVYQRSKRPTNAMISGIVQVTNLPRKRVVKWFEDKRVEDGIPDRRAPYQRPVLNPR